jgi:hypothetical protein
MKWLFNVPRRSISMQIIMVGVDESSTLDCVRECATRRHQLQLMSKVNAIDISMENDDSGQFAPQKNISIGRPDRSERRLPSLVIWFSAMIYECSTIVFDNGIWPRKDAHYRHSDHRCNWFQKEEQVVPVAWRPFLMCASFRDIPD